MKTINTIRILFSIIFFIGVNELKAQTINDVGAFKSSQITDTQLAAFIKKANESGMTDVQIEEQFKQRGMPVAEIQLLKERIRTLQFPTPEVASNQKNGGQARTTLSTGNDSNTKPKNTLSTYTIFGTELFSGNTNTFEPNLNMPTPRNYVVGPGDELSLDISGVNVSQQTLRVSAEGAINVKYAGQVSVNGLTIEEVTQKLTTKLRQYYPAIGTGKTKVTLTLGNIRSNKIIIVGAVNKPGTYTLPSLASLFNALYVSGGPTANGSFRRIELIRNNKKIITADLYDFLTKANQKNNIRLENEDIIRIPYAEKKITIIGEVNRQGIFELKDNETLATAIEFAGGYTANAYKARITGIRNSEVYKKIIDIPQDSIKILAPKNGDEYSIGSIINKFENLVTVEGAVYKPGNYSLEKGMTLQQLINKAAGLREDAYTQRIIIVRNKEDLTKQYLSVRFTPSKTLVDTSLVLQRDDKVQVSSIFDVKDQYTVTINGAVRRPGIYSFEDSLSLKSLILQAGGFAENATGNGIEISRRKRDIETNVPNGKIVEIIKIDDLKEVSEGSKDIKLLPYDIVSIKVDPYYKPQISVAISGEILIPGTYSLISREENISSLIKRAGGLLYTANVSGARLKRRNNINDIDLNAIKKIAQSSARDSSDVVIQEEARPSNDVAIDLRRILDNPGGNEDIFLAEGDELYIPVINNMISVGGEVFKPLDIAFTYAKGKKLKEYLSDAGGTTAFAQERKIFVIYANGRAAQTKSFLFFKKYPKIEPGSKIFVPREPKRSPVDLAKAALIIGTLSSLTTSLFLIFQISK